MYVLNSRIVQPKSRTAEPPRTPPLIAIFNRERKPFERRYCIFVARCSARQSLYHALLSGLARLAALHLFCLVRCSGVALRSLCRVLVVLHHSFNLALLSGFARRFSSAILPHSMHVPDARLRSATCPRLHGLPVKYRLSPCARASVRDIRCFDIIRCP